MHRRRGSQGEQRLHAMLAEVGRRSAVQSGLTRAHGPRGTGDRPRMHMHDATACVPMTHGPDVSGSASDLNARSTARITRGWRTEDAPDTTRAHARAPRVSSPSPASRRFALIECTNESPMNAAPMRPVTASGTSITVFKNMMMPSAMIA